MPRGRPKHVIEEGAERVVRSGRARDLTPPYGARRHSELGAFNLEGG